MTFYRVYCLSLFSPSVVIDTFNVAEETRLTRANGDYFESLRRTAITNKIVSTKQNAQPFYRLSVRLFHPLRSTRIERGLASAGFLSGAKNRLLAFSRHQRFVLGLQLCVGLDVGFILRDAIHGADFHALRCVVVAYALGAFFRVDDVDGLALRDGVVGALWLAYVAVDAFVGDDQ